jgi:hypothetical protein
MVDCFAMSSMVNDDFFSVRTGRTTPTNGVRPTFVTPKNTYTLLQKIFPSVCLQESDPEDARRQSSVIRDEGSTIPHRVRCESGYW